jgi:predicted nucleic acid-binding protein
MTKVYLDVCCLNRPYNDQTQERIRLEAVAVLSILTRVENGGLLSVSSTVVQTEINNNSNQEIRLRLQELGNAATEFVKVEKEQIERADALQDLGFHLFDALHIACAETAGADVFLTTDDRLLRLALRVKEQLTVRVANPANWLMEVITNERNDD